MLRKYPAAEGEVRRKRTSTLVPVAALVLKCGCRCSSTSYTRCGTGSNPTRRTSPSYTRRMAARQTLHAHLRRPAPSACSVVPLRRPAPWACSACLAQRSPCSPRRICCLRCSLRCSVASPARVLLRHRMQHAAMPSALPQTLSASAHHRRKDTAVRNNGTTAALADGG